MNAAKVKMCSLLSNDSLAIEIFIEQTILGSFKDERLVKHAGTGWQLNQIILPSERFNPNLKMMIYLPRNIKSGCDRNKKMQNNN